MALEPCPIAVRVLPAVATKVQVVQHNAQRYTSLLLLHRKTTLNHDRTHSQMCDRTPQFSPSFCCPLHCARCFHVCPISGTQSPKEVRQQEQHTHASCLMPCPASMHMSKPGLSMHNEADIITTLGWLRPTLRFNYSQLICLPTCCSISAVLAWCAWCSISAIDPWWACCSISAVPAWWAWCSISTVHAWWARRSTTAVDAWRLATWQRKVAPPHLRTCENMHGCCCYMAT